MKIILTGASGFLGKIIQEVLCNNEILTVGRRGCNIQVDLAINCPALVECDVVIHAAGKAHVVPKTEAESQDFFNTNVKGTANLLRALEFSLPKSFVLISTVAVYGREEGLSINEDAGLTATDAYGKSKIESELLVSRWCEQHKILFAILRLPLIAGPNPPGNLLAMINGIRKGYYFNISRGKAKKSLVLASDVAAIIPKAAEIGGIYNLTDGYHPSFSELSELISHQLQKSKPFNMPLWLANALAKCGDLMGSYAPLNSVKLKKITTDLTFDDSKARSLIGWNPALVLREFKIT